MVLEDESSDNQSSLSYMHSSSSTDGLNQVPFSLEDPDYKGLELDLMSPCEKHDMASKRLVAFEGHMHEVFSMCTAGNNCGFVEWVDHQWPPTMQNALLKVWAMVEDAKSARVNDNHESALAIHNLTEEKNKLEANYDKLVQDEVRKELIADMKAHMATEMAKKDAETQKLTQKYELLVNLTRAQATVIQNLKLNNMKEKQVLIEARMNLELKNAEGKENHIQEKCQLELRNAELLMGNEKLKEKFKGIQAILEK
nr:uncharacterized protein LOC109736319 [Aegilops tauschii subsp. strangulata]